MGSSNRKSYWVNTKRIIEKEIPASNPSKQEQKITYFNSKSVRLT